MNLRLPGCTGVFLLAGMLCFLTQSLQAKGSLEIAGKTQLSDKELSAGAVVGCFCPEAASAQRTRGGLLGLEREQPWSLPRRSLAGQPPGIIKILALRCNFPLESPDNPLTTGIGRMDLRTLEEFSAQYGHEIDPSPHDSVYFDSHLRALASYYTFVSRGKVSLSWSVWPPGPTAAYELPKEMAYYGNPDSVEERLTEFFVDCITVADSVSPEIVFSDYNAVIIFHAGADRQNDLGFPETPNDLFTGFIKSGQSVTVDNGDTTISEGMFMPEQASQDSRAVALNAVLAHEFGHVLGLVDLYSTRNFFTQLGDFALMDNNGFGVGLDFGFPGVLNTFGAFPVYMSAWSRAYLGFDEVVELPMGTPLSVVAAGLDTLIDPASGGKIIKIPISRYEYYLIENRQTIIDTAGGQPFALADSITSVIQGPARGVFGFNEKLSGEYDFLLPGSGLLIYHVDESVAFGDADGDGLPNFQDNDLQWDPVRRFITLVEADGFVDFGGDYFKGVGGPTDYWNPGTYDKFTSNTNPASLTSTGAHTNLSLTVDSSSRHNHKISVSATNDRVMPGFPVWGGLGARERGPVAADIDGAPGEEIVFASGNRIIVTAVDGGPGWRFNPPQIRSLFAANTFDSLDYYIGGDTTAELDRLRYPLNIFAELPNPITAGPVVGSFKSDTIFIAVAAGDTVYLFGTEDSNPFGALQPDSVWKFAFGPTKYLTAFDNSLVSVTTDTLNGFHRRMRCLDTCFATFTWQTARIAIDGGAGANTHATLFEYPGQNRMNLTVFDNTTSLPNHYDFDGVFRYGPAIGDLDRDQNDEFVVASETGEIMILSATTPNTPESPVIKKVRSGKTGYLFTGGPVIGDVDRDGYPDILLPGDGVVYGFNQNLSNLVGFPKVIDRELPDALPTAPPLIADVSVDGDPDVIVSVDALDTLAGSVYGLSSALTPGFPLPGGSAPRGAPALVENGGGAYSLAYVGRDGFLYNWKITTSAEDIDWRMTGADPGSSNYFDPQGLDAPISPGGGIVDGQFYCYPNPITQGAATVRYTLGKTANSVRLTLLDLSGQIVNEYTGPGSGGFANEIQVDCTGMTSGVYRMRIEAQFPDGAETAFTDIAIMH